MIHARIRTHTTSTIWNRLLDIFESEVGVWVGVGSSAPRAHYYHQSMNLPQWRNHIHSIEYQWLLNGEYKYIVITGMSRDRRSKENRLCRMENWRKDGRESRKEGRQERGERFLIKNVLGSGRVTSQLRNVWLCALCTLSLSRWWCYYCYLDDGSERENVGMLMFCSMNLIKYWTSKNIFVNMILYLHHHHQDAFPKHSHIPYCTDKQT